MTDAPEPQHAPLQEDVQKRHYVYIVRCADGSLYTGYSSDVQRRVAQHNAGKGARYTRAHLPVILLAKWSFPSHGEALRAEYRMKRLPRAQKLRLIAEAAQAENLLVE